MDKEEGDEDVERCLHQNNKRSDDDFVHYLKRIEIEALNRYLKALSKYNNRKHSSTTIPVENNNLTDKTVTKLVEKSTNNSIDDKTIIIFDWKDNDDPEKQFPKKL